MNFFRFNLKYLFIFLFLFAIELCIALYVQRGFIRGFIGDVLVIPLLFSFFKIFINQKPSDASKKNNLLNIKIASGVLLIALLVEILQLIKITDLLGIQNKIARIVIGSTYDVLDILAYIVGYIVTLLFLRLKL